MVDDGFAVMPAWAFGVSCFFLGIAFANGMRRLLNIN